MAKKQNKEKSEEEIELERNLKNPVYVNYNLLSKLEEIKRINFTILEIMKVLYQKILTEENQDKKENKEEREGTF